MLLVVVKSIGCALFFVCKAKVALEGSRMKRGNVKERSAAGMFRDSVENGSREHISKTGADSSRYIHYLNNWGHNPYPEFTRFILV